ncbi:MAG TPA: PLP-dependent aminotransferase family protein [Albitalea sp.]
MARVAMILHLDGKGPLYQQLARAIEGAILRGHLPGGARLPSTRDLAVGMHLSRNTVRAAYDQLLARGALVGRRGAGSFVPDATPTPVPAATPSAFMLTSRFARRVRENAGLSVGLLHQELRYNLQYAEPLADVRFVDAWRRELGLAASYTRLGYPPARGMPVLREQIAAYLRRRRGMQVTPDDILVVSGTQQALSLASRMLVDEGGMLAMEDPGYFAARATFRANGAQVLPVPVDAEGLRVDLLPRPGPPALYVTPAHQFPLGLCMSQRRRAELLAYAREHGCWIIEDDYDGALGLEPEPAPPLFALDGGQRVIHIGTFSKGLAPSLRLAYMVLPRALGDDFAYAKRLEDFGCPALSQAALARFIETGALERHLRRVGRALRTRRDALLEGLARHVEGALRVEHHGAAMHLVAWLDERCGTTMTEFIAEAARRDVGLHPVGPHHAEPTAVPALLLGYANLSPAEIDAACRRMGAALRHLTRRAA